MFKNWKTLAAYLFVFCMLCLGTAEAHDTYEHSDHGDGVPHGQADTRYPDHSNVDKVKFYYTHDHDGSVRISSRGGDNWGKEGDEVIAAAHSEGENPEGHHTNYWKHSGTEPHIYRYGLHSHKLKPHTHGNTGGGSQPASNPASPVNTGGGGQPTDNSNNEDSTVDEQQFSRILQNQPAVSSPVKVSPPPTMKPPMLTEWMLLDWSKGRSKLPQWIEIHNPNADPINLKGWIFTYTTAHRFRNKTVTKTISNFEIPASGTALLVTHTTRRTDGIDKSLVYNLAINNDLKRGWTLLDAEGNTVHQIVFTRGDARWSTHERRKRRSYQAIPSEAISVQSYYGDASDIGTPGHYEPLSPAAPALIRPKRFGIWADLKK